MTFILRRNVSPVVASLVGLVGTPSVRALLAGLVGTPSVRAPLVGLVHFV